MKRQLLVSAIVTLLLLSVLLFMPVKATASIPTWKMPRPTNDRDFKFMIVKFRARHFGKIRR